jgi:hypothetical protein
VVDQLAGPCGLTEWVDGLQAQCRPASPGRHHGANALRPRRLRVVAIGMRGIDTARAPRRAKRCDAKMNSLTLPAINGTR